VIRGLVFDLDGTLIDSRRDIWTACNFALRESGFAEAELEVVSSYVGDGARLLLSRASGVPESDARIERLLSDFLSYYSAHPVAFTTLCPGVEAALSIRELPLAVCTNKPRVTTDAVLRSLELDRHFHAVSAGDDLPERKPHPAPLLWIARELGVEARELVMIGDGPQDVECGKRAGARTVGVRGIIAHERLLAAEPDVVLGSLAELPELVARWQAE
jgi:2-phosphoglycolate phosphatase